MKKHKFYVCRACRYHWTSTDPNFNRVCRCGFRDWAVFQDSEEAMKFKDGTLQDSSFQNRQFETGAQRDNIDGKGRCDLLPARGLLTLAKHFEAGAKKYGDSNWQKGMPASVFVDSGLRHLLKFMAGDTDEDHLVAAVWNLTCCLDQRERIALGQADAKLNNVPVKPQ